MTETQPSCDIQALLSRSSELPPFCLEERMKVRFDVRDVFTSSPSRHSLFEELVHFSDRPPTIHQFVSSHLI